MTSIMKCSGGRSHSKLVCNMKTVYIDDQMRKHFGKITHIERITILIKKIFGTRRIFFSESGTRCLLTNPVFLWTWLSLPTPVEYSSCPDQHVFISIYTQGPCKNKAACDWGATSFFVKKANSRECPRGRLSWKPPSTPHLQSLLHQLQTLTQLVQCKQLGNPRATSRISR